MEQSKEIFVDFALAMKALQKRCVDACTGSMFLISDKDHGAIFSLAAGRIVDISYRSIRGPHALRLMREIKATKFFFKDNPNIAKDFPASSTLLPENNAIFKVFARDPGTAEKVTSTAVAKNGKILVVEDSAMARKALVKVLAGYETVEAADGFEALGKLGEETPDLVLLDLILPKMDGYAVLAAMKKDPNYKNIPVIVLTSRDALFDKLKGKMSGTDEYLTKPIKPMEVIEKVRKYLD
ncbi:MAG: response regulator [Gammaproteobacteria bacterium]|nr:response regulator [Gammaproteobacteria bacterium]